MQSATADPWKGYKVWIQNQQEMKEEEAASVEVKTLSSLVFTRHSTRAFLDLPVARSTIEEVLRLAQRSPSSTNIQPWRLTFAAGRPLERIRDALSEAFERNEELQVPPIPEAYHQYRTELGQEMYGPSGWNISRDDGEAQHRIWRQNFRSYDAPLVAVVGIDKSLNAADIVSVGMYLQTLSLLLTERGLGTCFQVSTVGYPQSIRQELDVRDDMDLLCTLAIGYEDNSQQINKLKIPRKDWRENVRFVDQENMTIA